MSVIRVLDASAWTKDIAESAWSGIRSSGIEQFIPQIHGSGPSGTGLNPHLKQQVEGALAAGITVHSGYTWPSWRWPECLDYRQRELSVPLLGIWLDVEATAGVHPDQIEDLRAIGVQPGIYASRNSWSRIMGSDARFQDVPLWVAHYRAGPWPTTLREGDLPYLPNSWPAELVVGWQWMGTTTLRDDQFDLNVFNGAWPSVTTPPVDEEELTVEQYEELSGQIKVLTGRVSGLEADVAGLQAAPKPKTAPAPAPAPSRKSVIVKRGDVAGTWFKTEGALLRLNLDFPSLARDKDNHVIRRFAPNRNWNLIIPDERLWTS